MTTHKLHLCPRCSRSFTPKYKVASYQGGTIICPRCQKAEKPRKQADSVQTLLEWSREAGADLRDHQDLSSEQHYNGAG
jgi:hypothetical protein